MSSKHRTPVDALPASGFVRQSVLLSQLLPFSAATLWRKVRAGTFPAPVKLSERVTAWRIEDVRSWMACRPSDQSSLKFPLCHGRVKG